MESFPSSAFSSRQIPSSSTSSPPPVEVGLELGPTDSQSVSSALNNSFDYLCNQSAWLISQGRNKFMSMISIHKYYGWLGWFYV